MADIKDPQDAKSFLNFSDKDGQFRRKDSTFRDSVSPDPSSKFPAAKDRYVLYVNLGCPWAHRTNIVRSLKGLEDVIQLVVMHYEFTPDGWIFNGENGTAPEDPLYGFKFARDLYRKADPGYEGRFTVPFLWDKEKETIVNNESSEIIRILYTAFDAFLPEDRRETARPLLPTHSKKEIDEMNDWVYNTVNNGVYKSGFATTQAAYEDHVYPLFKSLDRLEEHLGQPGHSPYLFGEHITEADIRLFTTLIRFDVAYYTLFKCNLKMIRHDYPKLHDWLRLLYWDDGKGTNGGAFQKTTNFNAIKGGYSKALKANVASIVPVGPDPHILPK